MIITQLSQFQNIFPSIWRAGKEVVDFPAPPKYNPEESFLECPYCFTLCSTEILSDKAWKSRLIHDLRPYICTYEDCRNHLQLYDSLQEWIQHGNSHRIIWRCPKHPSYNYPSLDELREHLSLKGHSAGDFEALCGSFLHAAETTLTASDRCCPICSLQLDTARSIHSHITLHLERIFLVALPRSIDQENDDPHDGESNNADIAFGGSRNEGFDDSQDAGSNLNENYFLDRANVATKRFKSVINTVIMLIRAARWWQEELLAKKRSSLCSDNDEKTRCRNCSRKYQLLANIPGHVDPHRQSALNRFGNSE